MSFSIQSGDQQYEETEQQIRRIDRQKSSRGQNRIQGRGGKAGRKQAIRQPPQESLRGARGRRLRAREQRQKQGMEDRRRDRGKDNRALFREMRRVQLRAFPREAERGRGDSDRIPAALQNPFVGRLRVAEKAPSEKGKSEASVEAEERVLRRAAPNRRVDPQLVRAGASEGHAARRDRRRHGHGHGALFRQRGNA